MTDHPPSFRLDEPPGTERRRRGGVSGMVLAELRELAGNLGVKDITGMRRGDLIEEIKRRQGGATFYVDSSGDSRQQEVPAEEKPVRRRASRRRVVVNSEEGVDADSEVRIDESTVVVTDPEADHLRSVEDAAPNDDVSPGVIELDPLALIAVAAGPEQPPPPKARFLLATAVLLAPGERDNWRAELETERWELRGDPRARRRASRSHLRHLLGAAWASWRHGGHGPSAGELR